MRKLPYTDLVLLEEFHRLYLFDSEKADVRITKLCQTVAYFSVNATKDLRDKLPKMFEFNWVKLMKKTLKRMKAKSEGKTRPDHISIDDWSRMRKYAKDGWHDWIGKDRME